MAINSANSLFVFAKSVISSTLPSSANNCGKSILFGPSLLRPVMLYKVFLKVPSILNTSFISGSGIFPVSISDIRCAVGCAYFKSPSYVCSINSLIFFALPESTSPSNSCNSSFAFALSFTYCPAGFALEPVKPKSTTSSPTRDTQYALDAFTSAIKSNVPPANCLGKPFAVRSFDTSPKRPPVFSGSEPNNKL